jgi:16S rRNA (guanine527-N7)-methyltransferase
MTEAEARAALNVPRETMERLDAFVKLLVEENDRQNLVSRGSIGHIWNRHILDSAQLFSHSPPGAKSWIDLGSGAGFPGLIIAALHSIRVVLVESRKLRVAFLLEAARTLGVENRIEIEASRVESLSPRPYDVISARAFAPLNKLLTLGERFSSEKTRWILPKGRNAKSELAAAESSWQGGFRLEPSLTDADAMIVVVDGLRRRTKGKKAR